MRRSRDAVGTSFITDCGEWGKRGLSRTFQYISGAVIRTIGRRRKVASWGSAVKEKSGSWAACDFAWEIAILFWAIPCIEEAPAVPGYFQGCPTPQVDGPHVECGKSWRLLAGQLLYPSGHLAGQCMEGSVQGLTSCFQRSELLYRGQSMIPSCLTAQRATQISSLNEIAASQ